MFTQTLDHYKELCSLQTQHMLASGERIYKTTRDDCGNGQTYKKIKKLVSIRSARVCYLLKSGKSYSTWTNRECFIPTYCFFLMNR